MVGLEPFTFLRVSIVVCSMVRVVPFRLIVPNLAKTPIERRVLYWATIITSVDTGKQYLMVINQLKLSRASLFMWKLTIMIRCRTSGINTIIFLELENHV